jgi:hypothetical protein
MDRASAASGASASTPQGVPLTAALWSRMEDRYQAILQHRFITGCWPASSPSLQGLLVPLTHRLGRAKTGKTVQFQLTPSTMARWADRQRTP